MQFDLENEQLEVLIAVRLENEEDKRAMRRTLRDIRKLPEVDGAPKRV